MKGKAAERSQKPPASLFQAPPEEETISLSKHVWRNPPPHPHPHPAGPQCPSYITMKSGWLRVCVNWAGLWFHSLAGQTWPLGAARSRRVTWHLMPWPYSLCLLTHPPGLRVDSPWEGSEKPPRSWTWVSS